MANFDQLGKELLGGPQGRALRDAAASPEARRLEETLDPAVERAARSGDPEQLRALLTQVLATDEGKALAQRLSKLGL